MTTMSRAARLYVQYGDAGTYWDASFTDEQLPYAGVDGDLIRHVSVHVDDETGALTLNEGYARGSTRYDAETALFREVQEAIVEALTHGVPGTSEYARFIHQAALEKVRRRERLAELAAAIEAAAGDVD